MSGDSRFRRRVGFWLEDWLDLGEALAELFTSRRGLVVIGDLALLLCAVLGLVHFWSRPVTLAGYAVLQAACLACQAVALFPVAWPGRGATRGDVKEISETHEGATLMLVCGTWIFWYIPALPILTHVTGDVDSHPVVADMASGFALMMACVPGLMAGVALSHRAGLRVAGDSPGPPGASDGPDFGDVDTGGGDFGD
ncbi:hypothetical protein [Streptomyces sp. NPDC005017]|uniref:hypothetical protein n=1 Tax=Streptomyces sp. NPDC005017 TaxID=3364706 RepID=UPI0036A4DEE8